MKKFLPHIPRYLLGLIYTIFGIAGLLNLFSPPPDLPEKMIAFMNGMIATGYLLTFIKLTETICGLLLIAGFFPALSLIILAPITINIFLVHFFLTPGLANIAMPIFMIVMHAMAAKQYWPTYKPLFDCKRS